MCIFNQKNSIIKNRIKNYILGSLYSISLTIIPFFLVIQRCLSNKILIFIIIFCFIVHFFVHCKFFLHLDFSIENRWNLIMTLFTCTIISIIITGSLWIMSHLNHY